MTSLRRLASAAALLSAALLSGCSSSKPLPLATEQGQAAPASKQQPASSLRVELAWQSSIGSSQGGHRLSLVDNLLCQLNDNGSLHTLDPETGSASVQIEIDATIAAGGPCSATRVVAITDDAQLIVVDRASGDTVWRRPLFSNVLGPPVLLGGTVIAMLSNGRVLAHSESTGDLLWEVVSGPAPVRFKGLFRPATLPDFNILVYGTPDGTLNSLNTVDGIAEWSVRLSSERQLDPIANLAYIAGPAINKSGVCASSYNGKVGCYNGLTGQALWQADLSAASTTGSDGESLFLVDINGSLRSYSISSGDLLWDVPGASTIASPLVQYWNGMLLVDGGSNTLLFYEAANGALVTRMEVPGNLIDAIEIDEDLVVSTADGAVIRLRKG